MGTTLQCQYMPMLSYNAAMLSYDAAMLSYNAAMLSYNAAMLSYNASMLRNVLNFAYMINSRVFHANILPALRA
ncbi:hypothetical protein NIES4075_19970 [Tolypothrix sp. NIES-4075]|nr:hypothetical protein NIES4075_19970 [Tolypothrix sp. NIES-4075]